MSTLTGEYVVGQIIAMHPAIKQVTLYSVQPGEPLGTGVAWKIIRKEADKETLLLAGAQIGSEHRLFQFLQQTQTVVPAIGNRVIDWNSITWQIKHIDYKMADRVYDCLLLKNM